MRKNKGIMIVGGGILQIYALKKAKELNLITYLTDDSEKCFARNYADYFYKIDTMDLKRNAKLAAELYNEKKIIAVYTQGTDVEYTVAYAAAKAGLPGISQDAAINCNDKLKMRELLSRNGLNHVKFARAKTISELKQAIKKVGFPCYIKPSDNSASRGITRIMEDSDIELVYTDAIKSCFHRKEILVESEIKGSEYSVDTVLYKGKLYPAGISDRIFLQKEKYAIQAGSRTPSLLSETNQSKMYEIMEKVSQVLGVENGAFKGDLILDENDNIKIIEVAARTSGGFDSQLRKPLSFGIDILKATIDISCGLPLDSIDLIPKWVKWSSTISVFPSPGIVKNITGTDSIKKMKGVKKLIMFSKVGDVVNPYTDCAKRTNYIISSADTLYDLKSLENKVVNTLKIKTEKK